MSSLIRCFSPITMPSISMDRTCCDSCSQPEVLYWKKGDQRWRTSTKNSEKEPASFTADEEDFDVCIVKAHAQKIRECPACREKFGKAFLIPDLWWKRYCRDSNGYFGYGTKIDEGGNSTGLTTWARFPVKLTNEGHPGYEWSKINVFTHWVAETHQTILIVFDAVQPGANCMKRVPADEFDPIYAVPNAEYFIDPYWIYIGILEKVVTLQDAAVWAVRDTVRTTEKERNNIPMQDSVTPKPTPDYRHLHETARHAIHVSETLDLAVKAARKILLQHETYKAGPDDQSRPTAAWKRAWNHTHQRLQFYEEMITSLQERSASNKARHFNEISLAYNMVAQFDSGISVDIGRATQRDSEAMKTVAFLTLLFLPATFVSAVFSTSFFDYDSGADSWNVSGKFWVYWVVAIPITVVTALLWYYRHHLNPSGGCELLRRAGSQRVVSCKEIEVGEGKAVARLWHQVPTKSWA
ncbi:hypothetical protein BDP55DRAFT_372526 [Colletotrichum godetiae]|uniref:CorA-like Mg2+ transporter n=1 Tax=Colletotrichum godetiae TaxID=1209918 RepID=A0AAJ0A951_9PEZI|nr:uncharacterized protein BDP55DRAFT_372526 [Colletotrichum godetiae]KAK1658813.1 hypothetical protein BDP55DRAFT_372526 [Colletotrichum godetiae]